MGGGVALVLAGVVEGLAIADGVAHIVLGRPLLGHACQLRIALDLRRGGGEVAFGVAECHGAGQLGIAAQEDAVQADAVTAAVLADAGDVAQALQRRQLGHVRHLQCPRQSATQASEAPQARDQRGGSNYGEAESEGRILPADRLELARVQRPLGAGGAASSTVGCCGGALGRRVASQAGRPSRGAFILFIIKLSHEYA